VVTLRDLNRTCATAALGREYYFNHCADYCGWRWLVGFDGGYRLGTASADFAQLAHHSNTIYGPMAAVHTDLEKPWGCCNLSVGLRAEWDFIWSSILGPPNNSNLQDVNVLFNIGVRY
jgi:hypothetical protein